MESNSCTGKIHCSKDTADLVKAAGKGRWLTERQDKIVAKGKGTMDTYFVNIKGRSSDGESQKSMDSSEMTHSEGPLSSSSVFAPVDFPSTALNVPKPKLSPQHARLVDWNVELLSTLLKNVVANRRSGSRSSRFIDSNKSLPCPDLNLDEMPFNEWAQAIDLPPVSKKQKNSRNVELPSNVTAQLHGFVTAIACLHGDNPFHK